MANAAAPRADSSALARYFRFAERGTNPRTEALGGLTTFFVMAYIIFVNPSILTLNGSAEAQAAGLVPPFPALVVATCLAAGIMTIIMGLVTNYPFALASGLGLNAVVAFDLIAARGVPWQAAMGVIFLEGLLITLLVLTGFREAVMNAVPLVLKRAISVGIGLFIFFIGLVNAGLVRVPVESITVAGNATIAGPTPLGALIAQGAQVGAPGTPVTLGNLVGLPILVAVLGLLLTLWLMARGVKAALLFGIVLTTAIAVVLRLITGQPVSSVPTAADLGSLGGLGSFLGPASFSTIGSGLNLGVFAVLGPLAAMLVIFSLMLSDFFDTMGTIVGVGEEAGFVDEQGRLPGADRVLLVDSAAAAVGGLFGVSSVTTYIESAAGVSEGARTGFASVVTGVLFLVAIVLTPFAGLVPPEATAPALLIVGFLMFAAVREIPITNLLDGFPALATMLLMPLSYSITNGIGAGFVTYVFLRAVSGRAREVPPLLWIVAAAFVVYFALPLIRTVFNV
jgi:adenine/guanine/hypoxanthine permease